MPRTHPGRHREAARLGLPLPWYVHPNRTGRDLQAELVAETIKHITTA
ncbi:hypothetical protein [Streptomyces cuspidosporus]